MARGTCSKGRLTVRKSEDGQCGKVVSLRAVKTIVLVPILGCALTWALSEKSYFPSKKKAGDTEQRSNLFLDQSQQSEQSTSPANTPKPPKPVLADGTPVRLRFVRAVVSSQVIAGEKVPLEVVEPVLVGNFIAIPQHTQTEAIVTMAQAGRSMGRGGNLQLKIESVRLGDGEPVPVRSVKDVKGGGRQAAALIANLTVWPFQVKGKNASVPAGTEITAYITGDFPVDPSKFQTDHTSAQEKNEPK